MIQFVQKYLNTKVVSGEISEFSFSEEDGKFTEWNVKGIKKPKSVDEFIKQHQKEIDAIIEQQQVNQHFINSFQIAKTLGEKSFHHNGKSYDLTYAENMIRNHFNSDQQKQKLRK